MFEVRDGQVEDCTKFISDAPQDHGYIVAVLGTATQTRNWWHHWQNSWKLLTQMPTL